MLRNPPMAALGFIALLQLATLGQLLHELSTIEVAEYLPPPKVEKAKSSEPRHEPKGPVEGTWTMQWNSETYATTFFPGGGTVATSNTDTTSNGWSGRWTYKGKTLHVVEHLVDNPDVIVSWWVDLDQPAMKGEGFWTYVEPATQIQPPSQMKTGSRCKVSLVPPLATD